MRRSKNIRRKVSLDHMQKFTAECFDKPEESRKAARILKAILEAQSPRLSEISYAMGGNPEASYKSIQRFLDASEPRKALLRLACEQAPFVLGDPTEIERKQARRTEYVGKLADGKHWGLCCCHWLSLPGPGNTLQLRHLLLEDDKLGEYPQEFGTLESLEHAEGSLGGKRHLS